MSRTTARGSSIVAATKKRVRQSTNGKSKRARIETPVGVPSAMARLLRPRAVFNWLSPQLSAMTPQYIEMILRGAQAGGHVQQLELFQLMMDTWPELSACTQELTYGLMRKKLIVEPFHEEDEKPSDSAVERSKLVSAALRKMSPRADEDENGLEGTLKAILDGWFRGVTVIEVMWQAIDDGALGMMNAPRSTIGVHPSLFGFNQDGVLGLIDNNKPKPNAKMQLIRFPEHKFLVGIHKAQAGTALSSALLRPLCWWWCASNFASDWVLNLAQVFGLPFRWANYTQDAPPETIDKICAMLQNMGSCGWAAFPAGTTMELVQASQNGSDHSPQGELLDRADRYARTLILGQTMTGGSGTTGKGGGQAFGTVEADVKDERIDAAGRYVTGIINEQLVKSILLLNYGNEDEAPQARFLEEKEGALPEAQRDQVLISMGLPVGADFLRKKYGIPEPSDGEEVVSGMSTGAKEAADAKTQALEKSAEQQKEQGTQESDDGKSLAEKKAIGASETSGKGHWVTINGAHVFIKEGEQHPAQAKNDGLDELEPIESQQNAGHWVTINGHHVFIKEGDERPAEQILEEGKTGNSKWNFTDPKQIGQVTSYTTAPYKKEPGNFTKAAQAAGFYAKKQNRSMMLVPGNSFMHKIYVIQPASEDIHKVTVAGPEFNVALVHPDGKVFQVTAKLKKAPIQSKNDGLDYYLGDLAPEYLEAFAGDLDPLRGALETALAGKTEEDKRANLIALQPRLPALLRAFVKHGTAPWVLAKAIAEGFDEGWKEGEHNGR